MIPSQVAAAVQHHWWLFLLRGVAALAFGVLTLAWPGATLLVLMTFIAAYALVDGIVALVYAFRLRAMFDRWWVLLVQGLISGAFGVLAFIYPTLSFADRKSTRLNSSHGYISYAVFCLKKKNNHSQAHPS